MRRVFVSYSHKDVDAARTLKRVLAAHGFDVWLDRDELNPGDNIAERIHDGLRSASSIVLLIGKDPSSWARNEWSQVLQMSWDRDRDLSLLPVLLPGADAPVFLAEQPHVRIGDEGHDWDRVADMLDASAVDAFNWRTSDAARTVLADRLTVLEKLAAALPHDAEAEG